MQDSSITQKEPNIPNVWFENEYKPKMMKMIFLVLRMSSLISKDQKMIIICTMDDIRGDV